MTDRSQLCIRFGLAKRKSTDPIIPRTTCLRGPLRCSRAVVPPPPPRGSSMHLGISICLHCIVSTLLSPMAAIWLPRHEVEYMHNGKKVAVAIVATQTSSWGMTYISYAYECTMDGVPVAVRPPPVHILLHASPLSSSLETARNCPAKTTHRQVSHRVGVMVPPPSSSLSSSCQLLADMFRCRRKI